MPVGALQVPQEASFGNMHSGGISCGVPKDIEGLEVG